MAYFDDELAQNGVHELLSRCETALDSFVKSPWTEADPRSLEYLEVARAATQFTRGQLAIQNAILVTPNMLGTINRAADALASALEVLASARTAEAASAMVGSAQSLVEAASALPAREAQDATAAFVDAERRLVSVANSSAVDVRSRSDQAMERLAEVREQSEKAIAELTSRQVSAEESLRTAVDAAVGAVNAKHADFVSQASALEQRRDKAITEIEDLETQLKSGFESEEKKRRAAADDLLGQFEAEFSERADHLQTLETHANAVLALAGGAALSGRWVKQANADRIERYAWIAAVAVIFGLSASVAWFNLDHLTPPSTYSFVEALVFFAPRIPLALITLTVLGFAVSQASKRGELEARDLRVSNELTAFPAFLQHLDALTPEQRAKLAQDIALKYFPGTSLENDVASPDDREQQILGIPSSLLASLSGNIALAVALLYALTK